jgi:hypothetical protein
MPPRVDCKVWLIHKPTQERSLGKHESKWWVYPPQQALELINKLINRPAITYMIDYDITLDEIRDYIRSLREEKAALEKFMIERYLDGN